MSNHHFARTLCIPLGLGLLASGAAVADTRIERQDALLPNEVAQVLALEDGSALVLGRSSSSLLRIAEDGSIAALEHPPAGILLNVANRGSELWLVGTQAVLRRDPDGSWSRLSFTVDQIDAAARLVKPGWGAAQTVILSVGGVAVIRTLSDAAGREGAEVLVLDAEMRLQRRFAFPGIVFSSAVPDAVDGLWTLVRPVERERGGSDTSVGYAHLSGGHWTFWRNPMGAIDAPLDGVELKRAAVPALLERLAPDGRGGAAGFWLGALYHINPDGELAQVGLTVPPPLKLGYRDRAIGVEPGSGNILIFVCGSVSGALIRLDPQGRLLGVRRVTFPTWFVAAPRAPLLHATLSPGPRSTWISIGPFVFEVKGDAELVAYSSPTLQQTLMERRRAADRPESFLTSVSFFVGASLPLGGGAYGASLIHGEQFLLTTGQAVGGAALSLLPALALDGYWPHARGGGPGLGGAMSFLFFGIGAVTAPVLGALGTWGTGELLQPSRFPGAAFVGALAGAAVGSLVSIGLAILLANFPPELQPASLGLTLGFIGGGAALGYQVLGGGPRAPEGLN